MQRLVGLALLFQGAAALVTNTNTDSEWVGEKVNGVWRNPAEKVNGAYPDKPLKASRTRKSATSTSTENRIDGSKPVFYAVIMGRLAFRHQVSLWVSSLRKIGKWEGVAVIVTDRPTCLAKTLEEAGVVGKKLSTSDNVDIFESGEGYKGNLHMVKRPLASSINMMKLEKARGWLNMQVAAVPHPVSSIVYTDEDIVIAKDLSTFMETVRGLESAKHTLALFRDTGASAGELHTGVVVMFPGAATDQCLQAWGKALTGKQIGSAQAAKFNLEDAQELALNEDNEHEHDDAVIKEDQLLDSEMAVMGPDQRALGRTKMCKKAPDHDGIRILPGRFFWLPTPGGIGGNGHRAEFVHFTNTGRWKILSHGAIKKYLITIGVPSKIDPTGKVQAAECVIPDDQGKINKGPSNYGR